VTVSTSALWLLAALPSLAALAALALPGRHRDVATRLAPLAPLAAVPLVFAGGRAGTVELPWLVLGTSLALDDVGRALLLVAALLYAAALGGAAPVVAQRRPAFAAFLLACWLGNAGVLVAADAATFYLSFAVMGFCAYGLVVHDRTPAARRAGRVYLALTVLGELALLSGLLLAVAAGGRLLQDAPAAVAGSPHQGLTVGLLIAGFGVKAGLVPLHLWLPLAHPAAPAPASAVLSGCMVKAGLVGMLRFLPLGEAEMPVAGAVVGGLALAAAFLAVVVGLTQRDPKANLAYSTVSQMGFHLVLVGVALDSPELAPAAAAAAVLYAVHHGIAKGALFLGVAVHAVHGGSRARPLVLGGLGLCALAVAGAPLTSGAAAKYSAKAAVEGAGFAGVELVLVLPLVGVGTTLLLLRFLTLLPAPKPAPVRSGGSALLAAWTALVVLGTPAVWLLGAAWLPQAPPAAADPAAVWAAAWPVLLALVVAAAVTRLPRRRPVPELPPGDVVVPVEAAVRRTAAALTSAASAPSRARPALTRPPWSTAAATAERRLTGWQVSGAATRGLLLVVAVLLAAP
jgi:hydrogenase-4 component B